MKISVLFMGVFLSYIESILAQGNTCTLPEGGAGQCIAPGQCDFVRNILSNKPISQSNIEYLRKMICEGNKACCPITNENEETRGGANPTISPKISEIQRDLLPDQLSCGRFEDQKIVGGIVASIYAHPWAALLEYTSGRGGNVKKNYYCGGSLISNRYILTAAHCVEFGKNPDNYKLIGGRLGENDLRTEQDCLLGKCAPKPLEIKFEEIIAHKNYIPDNRFNDIALLRLAEPVNFSEFVYPLCLPTTADELSSEYDNEFVEVVGWGKTENSSSSPVKLRIQLPIVNIDECIKIYRFSASLTKNQICAGGDEGRDTCGGDSGGIIAMPNDRGRWMGVGIVSYGPTACGSKGVPGIYTRINKYMDWITKHLKP